jgi:hypothetical protein
MIAYVLLNLFWDAYILKMTTNSFSQLKGWKPEVDIDDKKSVKRIGQLDTGCWLHQAYIFDNINNIQKNI